MNGAQRVPAGIGRGLVGCDLVGLGLGSGGLEVFLELVELLLHFVHLFGGELEGVGVELLVELLHLLLEFLDLGGIECKLLEVELVLEYFHLLAQLLGTERGWLELAEGGGLIAESLGWVRVQRAEELHYVGVDFSNGG